MCLVISMTTPEYSNKQIWTSGYVNRPFETLLANPFGGAKRTAQGAFSYAGSTKSHVLTTSTIEFELLDNLIENTYREWVAFERVYQERKVNRKLSAPPPYTPIETVNL